MLSYNNQHYRVEELVGQEGRAVEAQSQQGTFDTNTDKLKVFVENIILPRKYSARRPPVTASSSVQSDTPSSVAVSDESLAGDSGVFDSRHVQLTVNDRQKVRAHILSHNILSEVQYVGNKSYHPINLQPAHPTINVDDTTGNENTDSVQRTPQVSIALSYAFESW